MRAYEFITEARKNPEQNPKVAINQYIQDRLDKTQDLAGGTPNLFVSFTKIDKLGINPKSQYDTPLGIYSYPAAYIQEKIGTRSMMSDLPFAGEEPFANIFNSSGNIVNLNDMSDGDLRHYYQKIAEFYITEHNIKKGSDKWKEAVDEIETIINNVRGKAKFPSIAGGRFWYVTWQVAQMSSYNSLGKMPVTWNKLFRHIGIDGCVDMGEGIIHTSEPYQAVFFSIKSIKNNQRVHNKYSPDAISSSEYSGQRQRELNRQLSKMSVEQQADYFLNNPNKLRIIKKLSPNVQMASVKSDPSLVNFMTHLSNLDPKVLQYALLNMAPLEIALESFKILGDDMIMHLLLNRPDSSKVMNRIAGMKWYTHMPPNSIELSPTDQEKFENVLRDNGFDQSLIVKNPTAKFKHFVKMFRLLRYRGNPSVPLYLADKIKQYLSKHPDLEKWFYSKDI